VNSRGLLVTRELTATLISRGPSAVTGHFNIGNANGRSRFGPVVCVRTRTQKLSILDGCGGQLSYGPVEPKKSRRSGIQLGDGGRQWARFHFSKPVSRMPISGMWRR